MTHHRLLAAVLVLAAGCATAAPSAVGNTTTTVQPGTSTVDSQGTGSNVEGRAAPVLPRADLTPGKAADPSSPSGTTEKLCAKGFTTKSVRPSVSVSERIKRERMAAYGIPETQIRGYELDHLVPLSSGGDPLSDQNLWPEPWERDGTHPQGVAAPGTGAQSKDKIEVRLARAICAGRIQLADAQHRIAADWPHALDGIAVVDLPDAAEEG